MAAPPPGQDLHYYYTRETPPPAPPKSPTYPTSTSQAPPPPPPPPPEQPTSTATITTGPPLPPPPPSSQQQPLPIPSYPPPHPRTPHEQLHHQQQEGQQQQQQQPPPQPLPPSSNPHAPQPPQPHEPFLPSPLPPKTTAQLTPLLSSPPHLAALSHLHPSLHPSASPLPPLLTQTANLATHLQSQHTHLLALRARTQSHLLHLHGLERQWRDKQARLDKELEPWSAKRLYARLREKEREGEDVSVGVEGSWLDGRGEGEMVGEREVGEFLRGWREGRGRVWRRREVRERWDEGRVGGWR